MGGVCRFAAVADDARPQKRKDVKYGDDGEEVERRKKYDKYSVFKIAYELYSAMYKEKLKCGTKTIVE